LFFFILFYIKVNTDNRYIVEMSRLQTINVDDVTAENIIFDFLAINSYSNIFIDQDDNERLLVHQYDPDRFSIIAGKQGLAIKTTREIAKNMNNFSLFVDGNAYVSGSIHASNIELLGSTINDSNVDTLLRAINEKVTPWSKSGTVLIDNELENMRTNYYINDFINVGPLNNSIDNLHPVNIAFEANNRADKCQLSIHNRYGNPITGEKSQILIGIIGDNIDSPGVISTSEGKSLEFYVAESTCNINNVYLGSHMPDYTKGIIPAMVIDNSKCVNINGSNMLEIGYNLDESTSRVGSTKLNVNGLGYISDICMDDHVSGEKKHLSDIFVRREGLTLHPEQLYEGTFHGDFIFGDTVNFRRDVMISNLSVDGVTELSGDRLSVFGSAYFNGDTTCDSLTVHNVNVNGTLQKDGSNIVVTEIEKRYISYDVDVIKGNIPSDAVYKKDVIDGKIYDYIYSNGNNGLYEFIKNQPGLCNVMVDELYDDIYSNVFLSISVNESDIVSVDTVTVDIYQYVNMNGTSNLGEYISGIPLVKEHDVFYTVDVISSRIPNDIYYDRDEVAMILNNYIWYSGSNVPFSDYIKGEYLGEYSVDYGRIVSNVILDDDIYGVDYVNSVFYNHIYNCNLYEVELRELLGRGVDNCNEVINRLYMGVTVDSLKVYVPDIRGSVLLWIDEGCNVDYIIENVSENVCNYVSNVLTVNSIDEASNIFYGEFMYQYSIDGIAEELSNQLYGRGLCNLSGIASDVSFDSLMRLYSNFRIDEDEVKYSKDVIFDYIDLDVLRSDGLCNISNMIYVLDMFLDDRRDRVYNGIVSSYGVDVSAIHLVDRGYLEGMINGRLSVGLDVNVYGVKDDSFVLDVLDLFSLSNIRSSILDGYVTVEDVNDILWKSFYSNDYMYMVDVMSNYVLHGVNGPDYTVDISDEAVYSMDRISYDISVYLKENGVCNILTFLSSLNLKDRQLREDIAINLITQYDAKTTTDTVLTYAIVDKLNVDGENLTVPGRLGVGVKNDIYDSMLNVVRRDNVNNPEIMIRDIVDNLSPYEVTMGHSRGVSGVNNSFSVCTNGKRGDHHMSFYAGVLPRLSDGVDSYIPNLFLEHMRTTNDGFKGRVGVNTVEPVRDLHVNGDMFVSKKIYMEFDDLELESVNILKNSNVAFANNIDRLPLIFNVPSLRVYGGAVVADDYYIGDDKLVSFKKKVETDVVYNTDGNVSLGYLSDVYGCDNAALQVRNSIENGKRNNSVIRIYEANAYWENDDRYSGVEIAREPYNPEKGWYIHNIHDGANRFVIGWRDSKRNNVLDVLRYSDRSEVVLNNSSNDTMLIHGDVSIDGDLNVIGGGKYKLNGLELTSNSISLSAYLDSDVNYELNELVTTDKDVMINGNRVMTFVGKNSSAFIGESTPYSVAYMNEHSRQSINPYQYEPFDARLVVYQRQLETYTDIQPIAVFSGHPERGDSGVSKIRLGVLPDRVLPNGKHWDLNSHVDIGLYSSVARTEYSVNMRPFKGVEQSVMSIMNEGDNLYYRFGRGRNGGDVNDNTENNSVKPFIHVYDDNDIGIYVENKNQSAKIRLNSWEISCGDVFMISDNGSACVYVDNDKNIGLNVSNPKYSLDIDRMDNDNDGCMRLKNTYRSNANSDVEVSRSVLLCNIDGPVIIFDEDVWRVIMTGVDGNSGENLYPKVVEYRCNIDISIPYSVDVYDVSVYDYRIWNSVGVGRVSYGSSNEVLVYSNVFHLMVGTDYDMSVLLVNRKLDIFETDRVVLYSEYSGLDVDISYKYYSNVSNVLSPQRDIWYYYSEFYVGTSNVDTEWVLANEEKSVSIDVDGVGEIHVIWRMYNPVDFVLNVSGSVDGVLDVSRDVVVEVIEGIDMGNLLIEDCNIRYIRDEYLGDELVRPTVVKGNVDLFGSNIEVSVDVNVNVDGLSLSNMVVDVMMMKRNIKPHIVLDSYITEENSLSKHHIFAHDGLYEMFVDRPEYGDYRRVLSLDKDGMLDVRGLKVKDIQISGRIYDELDRILREQTKIDINSIIVDDLVYVISKNEQVLINTDVMYNGGNVVIGNRKEGSDNVLSVKSYNNENSFIHIEGSDETGMFRVGVEDSLFKIYKGDKEALSIEEVVGGGGSFKYTFHGVIEYSSQTHSIDVGDITLFSDRLVNDSMMNDNVIKFQKGGIDIFEINTKHSKSHVKFVAENGIDVRNGINQLSDRRAKTNLRVIDDALCKVDMLEGYVYSNLETGCEEVGLIAQDVERVLPEAVREDCNGFKTLQYGNMMGLMVEAIKELRCELEDIKKRL
jgi:hypothetical protein